MRQRQHDYPGLHSRNLNLRIVHRQKSPKLIGDFAGRAHVPQQQPQCLCDCGCDQCWTPTSRLPACGLDTPILGPIGLSLSWQMPPSNSLNSSAFENFKFGETSSQRAASWRKIVRRKSKRPGEKLMRSWLSAAYGLSEDGFPPRRGEDPLRQGRGLNSISKIEIRGWPATVRINLRGKCEDAPYS
jgi:hypothetical protein